MILVYGKSVGCPQCDEAKRKLDELGVEYSFINVLDKPDLITDLRINGVRSVPAFFNEEGFLLGQGKFDEKFLRR